MVNADPCRIFLKVKEDQVLTRECLGKTKHKQAKYNKKPQNLGFFRTLKTVQFLFTII